MVASPDHLASEAGVAMLRAGGSAGDAAVAASAMLAVTAPHLCGPGGDLWALVHVPGGPPVALNASGRAGSGADPQRLRAEGHDTMPLLGDVRSVPVPGCVDGWCTLHERFGRLQLGDVLAPAISAASEGFPASPLLAAMTPLLVDVADVDEDLRPDPPPASGQRVRRPGTARALAAVAEHGRSGFYEGEFGAALLQLGAGEYAPDDLARRHADWVPPLDIEVAGHRVWTVPPNSQGYLTLAALWIAHGLGLPEDPADARWAHLLVESARQAGRDRPQVLHEHADGRALLALDRLAARRDRIDADRRDPATDDPAAPGDTIHLCAIDSERMGVSLVQSNALGFGSGIVAPGTGIFLHNRGIGFCLRPGHPAEYAPGRRPPSTLSPALVTDGRGALRAVVGTMGGDAQPQVLLQVVTRLLAGSAPGPAIGAPRWVLGAPEGHGFDTWADPPRVEVRLERDVPPTWAEGLVARGHPLAWRRSLDSGFGHANLVEVDPRSGMLAGAADPRAIIAAATGY